MTEVPAVYIYRRRDPVSLADWVYNTAALHIYIYMGIAYCQGRIQGGAGGHLPPPEFGIFVPIFRIASQ